MRRIYVDNQNLFPQTSVRKCQLIFLPVHPTIQIYVYRLAGKLNTDYGHRIDEKNVD